MKWFTGVSLLALGLMLLPACADDNNEAVAPVFPEKVAELSVASAGEQAEFAFKANTDWTLTSSKLWCKFVSGKESVPMLAGAAGEQKVQIVVTDDIWDFEAATAEVSLNMEGQSKVVAKVTRGAKGFQISIYGSTEEEVFSKESPYIMKYGATGSNQNPLNVFSNFGWHIKETEIPTWMILPDSVWQWEANHKVRVVPLVKKENRVKAHSGELKFYNSNDELQHTLYVNYGGMPADVVEFADEKARWNWVFSVDGMEHWQENDGDMGGGTPIPQSGAIPFAFEINSEYEMLHFEKVPEKGYQYIRDASLLWYEVADLSKDGVYKAEVSVSEPNSESYVREAVVMVVPKVVLDTITGGREQGFLEPEDVEGSPMMIKTEYENRYAALMFSQQTGQVSEDVFEIEANGETLIPQKFIDISGQTEEEIIQIFGTKDVYACSLKQGQAYNPLRISQKLSVFMVVPCVFSEPETLTAWSGVTWEKVENKTAIIEGIDSETGMDELPMTLTFFDGNGIPNSVLILMRE